MSQQVLPRNPLLPPPHKKNDWGWVHFLGILMPPNVFPKEKVGYVEDNLFFTFFFKLKH